jgi:hypothetical protein
MRGLIGKGKRPPFHGQNKVVIVFVEVNDTEPVDFWLAKVLFNQAKKSLKIY